MSGVDVLVGALRFTVPLHIYELRAREVPPWLSREQVLTAIVSRCAGEFASRGDQLMFIPKSPSGARAARRAGLALSEGVAAAALLNPATGVDVLGAHFCAATHLGCPLTRPDEPGEAAA